MSTTTYNDLAIINRYLPEIVTFIQDIVHDEAASVVIACEVFENHKKREDRRPFVSENKRLVWLHCKSRFLCKVYITRQHEKVKDKAIKAAIHDCL